MISLEIRGFDEALALLEEWEKALRSEEMWDEAARISAAEFRRYAMRISPVVTGAYQSAHIITPIEGMGMALVIDEGAINPVSGTRVIEYAGPVENMHHVYQRTFDHVTRAAGIEAIMEALR